MEKKKQVDVTMHFSLPWRFDPYKEHKLRSFHQKFGEYGSPSIAFIQPGGYMGTHPEEWAMFQWLITESPLILAERDRLREENGRLKAACQAVVKYLEERGIREQGIVGRTQILPMLDAALSETEAEHDSR